MTTFRTCPQCGQAYTGRADKRFCSAACRSHHFRYQQTLPEQAEDDSHVDLVANELTPGAESKVVTHSPISDATPPFAVGQPLSKTLAVELIARSLQDHARQQAQQQAQRQSRELLEHYQQWVQTILDVAAQPLAARTVQRYLQQTNELSTRYRSHSLVSQLGHPAYQRLQLLYKISDTLRKLQRDLAAQPSSWWGQSTSDLVLDISKKRRQQLRDSLLGEA